VQKETGHEKDSTCQKKQKKQPNMKRAASPAKGTARKTRVGKTKLTHLTIGMDLGDKTSRYCVLDEQGEVLFERSTATTKKGMAQAFGALGRCRLAIEVGTHSRG